MRRAIVCLLFIAGGLPAPARADSTVVLTAPYSGGGGSCDSVAAGRVCSARADPYDGTFGARVTSAGGSDFSARGSLNALFQLETTARRLDLEFAVRVHTGSASASGLLGRPYAFARLDTNGLHWVEIVSSDGTNSREDELIIVHAAIGSSDGEMGRTVFLYMVFEAAAGTAGQFVGHCVGRPLPPVCVGTDTGLGTGDVSFSATLESITIHITN